MLKKIKVSLLIYTLMLINFTHPVSIQVKIDPTTSYGKSLTTLQKKFAKTINDYLQQKYGLRLPRWQHTHLDGFIIYENFHITLLYGTTGASAPFDDAHVIAEIDKKLNTQAKHNVQCCLTGNFALLGKNSDAFVMEVQDMQGSLQKCNNDLIKTLNTTKGFIPSSTPFKPHMTLFKLNEKAIKDAAARKKLNPQQVYNDIVAFSRTMCTTNTKKITCAHKALRFGQCLRQQKTTSGVSKKIFSI